VSRVETRYGVTKSVDQTSRDECNLAVRGRSVFGEKDSDPGEGVIRRLARIHFVPNGDRP